MSGAREHEGPSARRLDPAQQAAVRQLMPIIDLMVDKHLRFRSRNIDRQELKQIASEALIEAQLRFDPELGKTFEHWATLSVRWALRYASRKERVQNRFLGAARRAARDLIETRAIEPGPVGEPEETSMARLNKAAADLAATTFAAMEGARDAGIGEEAIAQKIDASKVRAIIDAVIAEAPETYGLLWHEHYVKGTSLTNLHKNTATPWQRMLAIHEWFLNALRRRLGAGP